MGTCDQKAGKKATRVGLKDRRGSAGREENDLILADRNQPLPRVKVQYRGEGQ